MNTLCSISFEQKNASMPVIMLTTLDKDVHIEKAKKLGADFYIVKPFTKEKIEEALKSIGFSI